MDITIEQYTGSHRDLDWSFREADDSAELTDDGRGTDQMLDANRLTLMSGRAVAPRPS